MDKKYFNELARILTKQGIQSTVQREDNLTVLLDGQPACHVGATSQMYVAPSDLRTPEADDLYHRTAPIADMVREYMTAIEKAPLLKARALDEDFRLLVYARLETIGLGHVAISDCCAAEIGGDYPILKRLEKTAVNVDELDYLAKRLESFDPYELAQFQGAAVSYGYFDMRDLINLTFCCQEVTVVQDFTDLTAIGRKHYMDLHGGLTEAEQKTVDFRKTALSLLLTEEGKITPYGVVYDNGMKLEPIYDGLYFPDYRYSGDTLLTIAATDEHLPQDTKDIAWLYLPMEDCQIERARMRAGIQASEMRLCIEDNELPDALSALVEINDVFELNRLLTHTTHPV